MAKPRQNLTLTHDRLLELVHYDPETGLFTWREHRSSLARKGNVCGYVIEKTGQAIITVDNVRYLGHRLAWFYMTGQWPKDVIDHIDRTPSNNRWANLRECNHEQNMHNILDPLPTNKSGVRGVCKPHDKNRWRVTIGYRDADGKHKSRYIGYFDTLEEAAEARRLAVLKYHGEFVPKELSDA